jgi:uncharacterized protein (DUF58 family)
MRKLKLNKWSDYKINMELNRYFFKDFIINNLDCLKTKPLYISCLILLTICALFKTYIFVFIIPLLGLYIYNGLAIKSVVNKVKVKRTFSKKSKEENSEIVHYSIENSFNYSFSNFSITDVFQGHKYVRDVEQTVLFSASLRARSKTSHDKAFKLNNGMGKKYFGPMEINLTDQMGINEVSLVYPPDQFMDIYPKVNPTIAPKTKANDYSVQYGLFDSFKKGDNVNFYCTREYQPGDNVKKINWKLSLKSQSLIINEFENNTNSNINIIILDDQRLHLGAGRNSSLEYCKDLSLSLCHQHINSNNSIAMFGHSIHTNYNSGRNHLINIELKTTSLELTQFPKFDLYHKSNKVPAEIVKHESRIKKTIYEDSNTYIFTGLIPGKLWDFYLNLICNIKRKTMNTHLIVIDGIDSLLSESNQQDEKWLAHIKVLVPNEIDSLRVLCRSKGIKLSILTIGKPRHYRQKVKTAYATTTR